MKIILCLSILISATAWSKTTVINFNQVLNEEVAKDIKKDDEKFKKEVTRGPASVDTQHEPVIDEPPKIDKNVRQIGPNKW